MLNGCLLYTSMEFVIYNLYGKLFYVTLNYYFCFVLLKNYLNEEGFSYTTETYYIYYIFNALNILHSTVNIYKELPNQYAQSFSFNHGYFLFESFYIVFLYLFGPTQVERWKCLNFRSGRNRQQYSQLQGLCCIRSRGKKHLMCVCVCVLSG